MKDMLPVIFETFDDGTNGEKYVRNVSLNTSNIAHKNKVGSITIEENILTNRMLSNNSFNKYTFITEMVIPYGVTSIGDSAFQSCSSLISINLLRTTPPTLQYTNAFSGNATGRTFYIPENTYTAYSTATNWSTYASAMEEVI